MSLTQNLRENLPLFPTTTLVNIDSIPNSHILIDTEHTVLDGVVSLNDELKPLIRLKINHLIGNDDDDTIKRQFETKIQGANDWISENSNLINTMNFILNEVHKYRSEFTKSSITPFEEACKRNLDSFNASTSFVKSEYKTIDEMKTFINLIDSKLNFPIEIEAVINFGFNKLLKQRFFDTAAVKKFNLESSGIVNSLNQLYSMRSYIDGLATEEGQYQGLKKLCNALKVVDSLPSNEELKAMAGPLLDKGSTLINDFTNSVKNCFSLEDYLMMNEKNNKLTSTLNATVTELRSVMQPVTLTATFLKTVASYSNYLIEEQIEDLWVIHLDSKYAFGLPDFQNLKLDITNRVKDESIRYRLIEEVETADTARVDIIRTINRSMEEMLLLFRGTVDGTVKDFSKIDNWLIEMSNLNMKHQGKLRNMMKRALFQAQRFVQDDLEEKYNESLKGFHSLYSRWNAIRTLRETPVAYNAFSNDLVNRFVPKNYESAVMKYGSITATTTSNFAKIVNLLTENDILDLLKFQKLHSKQMKKIGIAMTIWQKLNIYLQIQEFANLLTSSSFANSVDPSITKEFSSILSSIHEEYLSDLMLRFFNNILQPFISEDNDNTDSKDFSNFQSDLHQLTQESWDEFTSRIMSMEDKKGNKIIALLITLMLNARHSFIGIDSVAAMLSAESDWTYSAETVEEQIENIEKPIFEVCYLPSLAFQSTCRDYQRIIAPPSIAGSKKLLCADHMSTLLAKCSNGSAKITKDNLSSVLNSFRRIFDVEQNFLAGIFNMDDKNDSELDASLDLIKEDSEEWFTRYNVEVEPDWRQSFILQEEHVAVVNFVIQHPDIKLKYEKKYKEAVQLHDTLKKLIERNAVTTQEKRALLASWRIYFRPIDHLLKDLELMTEELYRRSLLEFFVVKGINFDKIKCDATITFPFSQLKRQIESGLPKSFEFRTRILTEGQYPEWIEKFKSFLIPSMNKLEDLASLHCAKTEESVHAIVNPIQIKISGTNLDNFDESFKDILNTNERINVLVEASRANILPVTRFLSISSKLQELNPFVCSSGDASEDGSDEKLSICDGFKFGFDDLSSYLVDAAILQNRDLIIITNTLPEKITSYAKELNEGLSNAIQILGDASIDTATQNYLDELENQMDVKAKINLLNLLIQPLREAMHIKYIEIMQSDFEDLTHINRMVLRSKAVHEALSSMSAIPSVVKESIEQETINLEASSVEVNHLLDEHLESFSSNLSKKGPAILAKVNETFERIKKKSKLLRDSLIVTSIKVEIDKNDAILMSAVSKASTKFFAAHEKRIEIETNQLKNTNNLFRNNAAVSRSISTISSKKTSSPFGLKQNDSREKSYGQLKYKSYNCIFNENNGKRTYSRNLPCNELKTFTSEPSSVAAGAGDNLDAFYILKRDLRRTIVTIHYLILSNASSLTEDEIQARLFSFQKFLKNIFLLSFDRFIKINKLTNTNSDLSVSNERKKIVDFINDLYVQFKQITKVQNPDFTIQESVIKLSRLVEKMIIVVSSDVYRILKLIKSSEEEKELDPVEHVMDGWQAEDEDPNNAQNWPENPIPEEQQDPEKDNGTNQNTNDKNKNKNKANADTSPGKYWPWMVASSTSIFVIAGMSYHFNKNSDGEEADDNDEEDDNFSERHFNDALLNPSNQFNNMDNEVDNNLRNALNNANNLNGAFPRQGADISFISLPRDSNNNSSNANNKKQLRA